MIYFIKQLCFLGLLSEGQMSKAYKESSQSLRPFKVEIRFPNSSSIYNYTIIVEKVPPDLIRCKCHNSSLIF